MMINFDTELDAAGTTRMVITDIVPKVRDTVTVRPAAPAPEPTPASTPAGDVSWELVRDYVIEQIGKVVGPFPRDTRKENTIFMNFVGRWGAASMEIARYAFEQSGGVWMGAPVGVFRFHRTSDVCFAQEIFKLL